ncbi:MAG: DMT family transporter [Mogibacterium sp.]|nr:DMT family transporter [Mogibacterium sp.]MBR3329938.1 DMT family transporter [Mogibacterium sp.]MBR4090565.1 DMT family transporter [Mogibacterium sp.]
MDKKNSARLQLIFTMLLFGTIGALSRYINMPSSIICLGRAFFGVVTILILLAVRKEKTDTEAIRRNLWWLILSSVLMCCNWICQFEAYKYTTIATSTLCYYMQPVFYILAGAVVLREKLTAKKIICVAIAFCGMILVSGVLQTGFHISELKGAIFGVTGGFFYAMVVLINKYMKDISPVNTTIMQLALVSVIMLPYSAATGAFSEVSVTLTGMVCLLILGVLHTGIGYIIYFDAVNKLPAQTVGILSYIDPVEAVMLSAFLLKEPVNIYTIFGAAMILGAAAVSELTGDKEAA